MVSYQPPFQMTGKPRDKLLHERYHSSSYDDIFVWQLSEMCLILLLCLTPIGKGKEFAAEILCIHQYTYNPYAALEKNEETTVLFIS